MPWKNASTMSLRLEFLQLACQDGSNVSQLCRRFGISRETGYKWLRRFREARGRQEGLMDRSRRPHTSPRRTSPSVEEKLLDVRREHPAWGARKIKAYLSRRGQLHLPSASTITAILRRGGQIDPQEARKHRPCQRFEHERPNQLWQMDFKGYFALTQGGWCHPLTVLDDHSRFLLSLKACPNQACATVQDQLTGIFRCYGLPERILVDNGPPWGDDTETHHTIFTAWLIRLGIVTSHCRPYHPQTQGKDERLHRTLKAELLSRRAFANLPDCQRAFNDWRTLYNWERPHEALDMLSPASRYQPSGRCFPDPLPPVLYDDSDIVRKVNDGGTISFRNHVFRLGKAFRHQPVAIRPTPIDGDFEVFFCHERLAMISFRKEPQQHKNV